MDYWRIIRIRKAVILSVFLLVVITTTVVTVILPKQYQSTVRISVEKDSSDIPGLFERQSFNQYDPYFIQTEFERIQSKAVLYKVIEKLDLNREWMKKFEATAPLKDAETFKILKAHIDVRQSRNTSLIEISVRDEKPDDAAKIAQTIAEVYKQYRLDQRMEMSVRGIGKLQFEYTNQYNRVTALQSEVGALMDKYKISDSIASGGGGPSTTLEPETLRRLEQERISAETELAFQRAKLNELKTLSRKELQKAVLTVVNDAALNDLILRLNDAEQRFASLSTDNGVKNPDVVRVVDVIKVINRQIDDRLDGIMLGLSNVTAQTEARLNVISNSVQQARDNDVSKANVYRPYFLKKTELDTERNILQTMKYKIIQEQVDMSLPKQSIVEITDPAEPSQKPFLPNIPLNVALGVVVGLLVGVGLAFFIEYLDTSVKTIDDVERALQAPVLGVIPQNVGSLLEEGPDSPHAEAYRVLRTNVLFAQKDATLNTLTVVSGGAGEGKSTTIFNLATVFAQLGHRVLIVDSDLRRPSLHKILGVSNNLGLTNYLLKQNTMEEVIQTSKQAGMDFLPSGKLPSSSMGILNSAQMKEFIQQVKRRYDFVFFDSPPIMGVSDASILASEVDLALLVIQYRKYPQAMTVRAKQMVEKVGGRLLGVVLNNINISQDSYYYYYSGYYYDY
ncbi:MAG TPA: polysaccharide biosynthesis tyrosine autokinase, partial [Verrucomicrobiae bacterium]|nr:polysaccharide biosynthesis tyrosine autokinase [Verrucomicrobiae bacterium]